MQFLREAKTRKTFDNSKMRKQLSRFCGGKRSTQHLPAISEEVNDTLLQNSAVKAEESREEILKLVQSRDKCGHSNIQNKRNKEGKQIVERKTMLFLPIHGDTYTDDGKPLFERTTNLLFQTEKLTDINEAKVLFPDFFPAQGASRGTWEAESSWKAKPTMEQIFSGQNNLDLTVKSGLRYDTNFEYWKRYQLSF